jgi:hypothetical protein
MVAAKGIHIADATQRHQCIGAQPLIHIHGRAGLRVQRGAIEAPSLGEVDQRGIVIRVAMVLDDEIVAVGFRVVPEIHDVHPLDQIGRREFVAGGIRRGWVVGQFEFEQSALTAIREGRANEGVFEPRGKDRHAVLRTLRRHHLAKVGIHAGHSGMGHHVL